MRFCFYQGMCRRRLWKRASLSIRDLLGEPGVGSFTMDFERRMVYSFINTLSESLVKKPFYEMGGIYGHYTVPHGRKAYIQ